MAFVVFNKFTNSPVTHGEAWVTVVWEGMDEAWSHAKNLDAEYAVSYPEMPVERRTWDIRTATPEEKIAALKAGVFGKEWGDFLGSGQGVR